MGYRAELHLLYPHDEDGRRVWQPREVIDFGMITRFEKLQEPGTRCDPDSHKLAGMCVVSILLGKLFERLAARADEVIAAPMLDYPYTGADEQFAFPGREVIDPGMTMDVPARIGAERLKTHNAAFALEPAHFQARLRTHFPIPDPPFFWGDSMTLAIWLHAAEDGGSNEWRKLQEDPLALALAKSWRFHLRQVGTAVAARALFVFR